MTGGRADQSKVRLANRALSLIECDGIESLDEGSNAAREVQLWFDAVRDALLRSAEWNFASARQVVGALVEPPAWGGGVHMALPADCLRVLEVNGLREGWRVEGRSLRAPAAPAELRYTRIVEDPNEWDALFALVFVHDLALACGPKLAQQRRQLEPIEQRRRELIASARRMDGREHPGDDMPAPPWVEVYAQ